MKQSNEQKAAYTSAKLYKQFLNTNFSVPVIQREKLPQSFSSPPIASEG
jgi:hypothetical protein